MQSGCAHSAVSATQAVGYCLLLSVAFVGSLYAFVPPHVRRRDRNDKLHVQWRCVASVVVTATAGALYDSTFCDGEVPAADNAAAWSSARVYVLRIRPMAGVLCHCGVLYLGSAVTSVVRTLQYRRSYARRNPNEVLRNVVVDIVDAVLVSPVRRTALTTNGHERWQSIRNFVVAPTTEETVFRGCMVPVLLRATESVGTTCLVAPLFFGVAHGHHAILQIRNGLPAVRVLAATTFQFAYTGLFGAYAAYVFIRTASMPSVVVCHAFCNWMGLPDLSFWNARSCLYVYRKQLMAAYVVGLAGFVALFYTDTALPQSHGLERMLGL